MEHRDDDTPFGSVETLEDARKCAALFKDHADDIDGVVVTLPFIDIIAEQLAVDHVQGDAVEARQCVGGHPGLGPVVPKCLLDRERAR